MITPSILAFALSGIPLGCQPAAPQEPQTVRNTLVPSFEATQSQYDTWTLAQPLGNLTSNGKHQSLLGGGVLNGFAGFEKIVLSGGLGSQEFSFHNPVLSGFAIDGIWWNPGLSILKTPSGFQIVTRKGNSFLEFRGFPSGQLRGDLFPPPPNTGELAQSTWRAIWNAGDVNLDGYDDVFFQSNSLGLFDGYSGLIDGASMTVVWRQYSLWSSDARPITPDPATGFVDLDGDGIQDFVSGWLHAVPPYNIEDFHLQLIAYSGVDGDLLWDSLVATSDAKGGIQGRDLNGDGVADSVAMSGGANEALHAIDGTDGSTIWSTDVSTVFPLIPGGGTGLQFDNPAYFQDTTDSASADTVSALVKIVPPGEISRVHYVATFRASDGLVLHVSPLPQNLEPWTPDPILPDNNDVYLLGDIDRDGYTEIARKIDTPSFDPGGYWTPWNLVTSLAILGPPTIDLPSTLPLGQSHRVDFEIPSAESELVQLLISTGFDRDGGIEIDHWPTNLVADPLLSWSRANPMTIYLGPGGEGGFQFTLPNNPALIGLELYFRGVVWEPSAPYQKVWTLSSLGQATVIP